MIQDIQRLIEAYHNWLHDKTHLHQIDEWVVITTPSLDRHNDYVQIYAKRDGNGFILTDDGYTVSDLKQSGCNLSSPKREALLRTTLAGFGVHMEGMALEVHASEDNFSLKKHNLLQAILAVNDMFYLAKSVVTSMFYEDVIAWLDLCHVRYTERVRFAGKSGYDHPFDFVIPKSGQQPERILKAINHPDHNAAKLLVFSWTDTREARPLNSRAYAVLNDSENAVSSGVSDALRNYGLHPVPWTERESIREELAA